MLKWNINPRKYFFVPIMEHIFVLNNRTNRIMHKCRVKYNTTEALVKKTLANKYKVSVDFVRMALRGDRDSETAEAIKKDFKKLTTSINKALA